MIAIGRRVYGLGAVTLGIVELAFGAFAEVWLPVPAHLHGYHVLLIATAGLLILAGIGIQLPRVAAPAALALAALFAVGMLALLLPPALAKPTIWGVWQGVAESTVMALGGVLAFTQIARTTRAAGIKRAARLLFGLCLLIFGISHFVYAKFTASLVPAWLPPSQLFWAYATGLAQLLAGLAILSGIRARLAAILLTIMYLCFGLMVHIPAILADPSVHASWAENAINLLLAGAAWCLADSLAGAKGRSAPTERKHGL